MPRCILRVQGSTTKVRRFLDSTNLLPLKVYWKGDVGFPTGRGSNKYSGFNIALSGSHGESIDKLSRQTFAFLTKNRKAMLLLQKMKFKQVTVDFGLYDLATENSPWPSYQVPAKLISLFGKFGFELELSFYGQP